MKLTNKNINNFLIKPLKQFKIFELGFTQKEANIFQNFKLPEIDVNGLAYSHYGNLETMNDLNNFLTKLGNNDITNINLLESKIKEITKTILEGYNKEYFWLNIRISYIDPNFDLERWHTDGKYFQNKNDNEFQSKFIMVFIGPGTLLLDNTKEDTKNFLKNLKEQSEESKEFKYNSPEWQTIISKYRKMLADNFKDSKILQLKNNQGLIFISHPGTIFEHGAIHSEPKKDTFRMFMQIIPGLKEDIELLIEKHKNIYVKEKEMWEKQKGGSDIDFYKKYLKYKTKYLKLLKMMCK